MATVPTTITSTCPRRCSSSGRCATRSSATRRSCARPAWSTWTQSERTRRSWSIRRPSGRWRSRCPIRAPPPRASSPTSGSRSATVPRRGRAGHGRPPMPEMTYLQAISDGLREEMRADETVFCLGEDIGAFGGAFKITDGFYTEFGEKRVWDTPLAENAIIGTAVGCAIEGMKPVAEMQFADFIACGFDQLVNVAAKMHYRQGIAVPMTVRLPSGGGFSGGPFHSQNPEAWFIQAPGLKVVAPSTPEDAKGLLAAAIQDPNPVLFMEHKHLYRRAKGPVPEGRYTVPIGDAAVAREGSDLSVIAYGAMVPLALEATDDIDGASVEVLDLRTVYPLDVDAILASVRKTSKVVVLHEATRSCGVGAEVAAIIGEHAFEDLDGPIVRVTAPDQPIPFSPPLERATLPQVDTVKEACRELLGY